jgi:carboxyl-terminal processing protease
VKLNLRQIRLAILTIALIILAGGIGYRLGEQGIVINIGGPKKITIDRTTPSDKNLDFSLFWTTWDRLSAAYLDKEALKPQEMIYGAIKGMVASLGDPYTVFLAPEENKEAKEDLNGSFEGVGIQLGYQDNRLAVIAPLSGMPAEKVGVKAGDLILKIDDRETTDITLPEAVKLIRGPKGTTVKLTLLHKGDREPYEASIVRGTIIIASVEVEFLEGGIAHLKLMRFGDRTSDEWLEAVDEIVSHQPTIKGVILDLRNNPGGYLSGSIFIASEFLSTSSADEFSGLVVQQEYADGTKESYSVDRMGKITQQPLVILVNQGSASASEIVAGALRDYGRAVIVGETTFGKGTIQEAEDLPGGAGLHVTTARWLLPSGESIDKNGIIPDNQIADDLETEEDEQLSEAIKILSN